MPEIRIVAKTPLSKGNRIVQRIGKNLVIKFGCPMASNSGQQNRIEAAAWQRVKDMPESVRRHFVPVLSSAKDGSWLIMPYVRGGEDYDTGAVSKLQRALRAAGLDSGDVHGGNWRMLNGTPVMIDYGFDRKSFNSRYNETCESCTWCTIRRSGQRTHANPDEMTGGN